MVLKIRLFISQHLVHYNYKKTRALIIFLVGNQKGYIVLLFLRNIFSFFIDKFFGYKIGIKFDQDPLVVEQSNYATKIVNACTVYELDT